MPQVFETEEDKEYWNNLTRLARLNVLAHKRTKDRHVRTENPALALRDFALAVLQTLQGRLEEARSIAQDIAQKDIPDRVLKRLGANHPLRLDRDQFITFFVDWIEDYKVRKDKIDAENEEAERRARAAAQQPTILKKLPGRGFNWREVDIPVVIRTEPKKTWEHIPFPTAEEMEEPLTKLFRAMDHADAGTVRWEDCVNYFVETGMQRAEAEYDTVKEYAEVEGDFARRELENMKLMTYSPDLDRVLAASNKQVMILNPDTLRFDSVGRNLTCIPLSSEPLHLSYLNGYGQMVVSLSTLETEVYELRQGRLVNTFKTTCSQICGSFALPWNTLYTGSRIGEVNMWAIKESFKHSNVCQTKPHKLAISAILTLPERCSVVTASMDGAICLLDPNTADVIHRQTQNHTNSTGIVSMSFVQDFNLLTTATFEPYPLVWVLGETSVPPFPLVDHNQPHMANLIATLGLPGTPQVLSLDAAGILKIWDVRSFKCIQTIWNDKSYTEREYKLFPWQMIGYHQSAASQNQYVVCGTRRQLYMHQYNPLYNGDPTITDDYPISCVLYNPYNNTLVTTSGPNLRLWDALSGSLHATYTKLIDEDTTITAVCMDNKGKRFYIGSSAGYVYAYNTTNAQLIKIYQPCQAEIDSVCFCACEPDRHTGGHFDRPIVFAASWHGELYLLIEGDSTRFAPAVDYFPEEDKEIIHSMDVKCIAFEPKTNNLMIGDTKNAIAVCHIRQQRYLHIRLTSRTRAASSSDGHQHEVTSVLGLQGYPLFASAETNGNISVHSMGERYKRNTYCLCRFVNEKKSPVLCLYWYKQTNWLFTGDDAGWLTVWSLQDLIDLDVTNES